MSRVTGKSPEPKAQQINNGRTIENKKEMKETRQRAIAKLERARS